jgi:hypothetical protein
MRGAVPLAFAVALLALNGCRSRPEAPTTSPVRGYNAPIRGYAATVPALLADKDLEARICPPPDWKPRTDKKSLQHMHRTWLSPTGDTAYGLIRFRLPFPVTHDLALVGFLAEMKRREGEARLISKQSEPNGGLHFVAEGGIYRVHGTMFVRGFRGWCVYAGSLRTRPENPPELDQARAARDSTRVGLE